MPEPAPIVHPSMLITPILPRHEVSVLAGASGAGKTTVLMQIISDLQHNRDVFGQFPCAPDLKIGYIVADRSADSAIHWGNVAGVDLSRMPMRSVVDDTSINLNSLKNNPLEVLFQLMGSMLPLDILVVDPLILFLGGDTKQYHENAVKLIMLNRWAKANKLTILGTHHAAKARSDYGFKRPQDRISGSAALLGFTSTQLFLNTPDESDEEFYTFHIIAHNHPAIALQLTRNDRGLFDPLDDPSALILSCLSPDDSTPKSELEKLLPSIAPRTLEYHLSALRESGRIIREGRGQYRIN